MHRRYRAVCGLLFVGKIRTFLGPRWPPRSPILSFARAFRSSCLSISILDRIPPWVGESGWTTSYSTSASWGCYSELVFWRPSFHPAVYLTFGTFSISVTWSTGGVANQLLLEDIANQLLLPIFGDVDPATLELSLEEEAVEAELKKRISENAKLSYWVSSSSKFSVSTRRAAFVVFWLCKFVFRSQPHYAMKPLYISV